MKIRPINRTFDVEMEYEELMAILDIVGPHSIQSQMELGVSRPRAELLEKMHDDITAWEKTCKD